MADTDLIFEGVLVNQPCRLSELSREQTLDFGEVNKRDFRDGGKSKSVHFDITLEDCVVSGNSVVALTFEGETDPVQEDMFALHGDSEGVAVAIRHVNGEIVKPGVETYPAALNEGTNKISWLAYLSGPNLNIIKEGSFNGYVVFTMRYD
ncbi:fimbrial protein [Pantoea endophytica]|uniref:Fimbrial protein n=1 Tax=Pantoea sp. BJ2 TaxID=3141322 RepID=A0AAU7U3F9_9GAMM